MPDSITVAAFVVGLVLVIAALIGKELKIAAVEIPALTRGQRVILGLMGVFLVVFGLTHLVLGVYMASVFAPNHKGMPLIRDRQLSFLQQQVVTSRNVRGGPVVDFLYGGLNYQIEHHLFPTMPRNNLAKAQGIVQEFCAEHGITYHTTSLFEGYRETFSHLHRVSALLRRQTA